MCFEPVHGKISAINLSKEESTMLVNGCKALGIKPYAAFAYAAVHSFNKIWGHMPYSLIQQA